MSNVAPTVLLDRDGTINREVHYLRDPDDLALLPGVADGLKRLQGRGCRLVVVTNQSAIGRGLLDETRLGEIHARLGSMLLRHDIHIAGWYWCPHLPTDDCRCRKPRPGMLQRARDELDFDARQAWMVGDRLTDVEAGRRAGAKTILVSTGYGQGEYQLPESKSLVDYYVPSLSDAADVICSWLDETQRSTSNHSSQALDA